MTILYEYTAGSGPILWLSIILWVIAGLLFVVGTFMTFYDKDPTYLFLYSVVAFAILLGFGFYSDNRYQAVKATINDTIPYTEVCKHYEYVSKEGDIWTLKVLEEKEE